MIIMLLIIIFYLFILNRVCKRYIRIFVWQVKNSYNYSYNVILVNFFIENIFYIIEVGKKKVFELLKVVGMIISLLVLFIGLFVIVMFMIVFQFEFLYLLMFIVCFFVSVNFVINFFIYSWKIELF